MTEPHIKELQRLIDVVTQLRHPTNGCPWDLEQTHQSLLPFLVEETYEYLYAVEHLGDEDQCEELGDVLFQVILHAQMANERSAYQLKDVAQNITDKLIRRHPHVFQPANDQKISSEEVLIKWEKIKAQEKRDQNKEVSAIPQDLAFRPALAAAHKIGAKSTKVGFDWDNVGQVYEKVREEWSEFEVEWNQGAPENKERLREELGDLFFSLAQLSRHLGFNAEEVLRESNQKFINRFHTMEQFANSEGKDFLQMGLTEKEELWQKAKKKLKGIGGKNKKVPKSVI